MIIMYVRVASRWFSVRGIHSTDTIFVSHGVEGRGKPCRIMLCRLSVRMALPISCGAVSSLQDWLHLVFRLHT